MQFCVAHIYSTLTSTINCSDRFPALCSLIHFFHLVQNNELVRVNFQRIFRFILSFSPSYCPWLPSLISEVWFSLPENQELQLPTASQIPLGSGWILKWGPVPFCYLLCLGEGPQSKQSLDSLSNIFATHCFKVTLFWFVTINLSTYQEKKHVIIHVTSNQNAVNKHNKEVFSWTCLLPWL